MPAPIRPIAFILASTDHGAMIVNRFDYKLVETAGGQAGGGFGVGFQLLNQSSYEAGEAAMVATLLDSRRKHFGDGVMALDLGANIGVFTVEWARHMTGWGFVVAVEAQERVFHALCGNVALNNCFNAFPICAAVTAAPGEMRVPVPNYLTPASFGSLELRPGVSTEQIGQTIDYTPERMAPVRALSIDTLGISRVDLMKVDVEGMEMDALQGARQSIVRDRPILLIENLKTDRTALLGFLNGHGYKIFNAGMNVLAIHPSDPTAGLVTEVPAPV